MRLAVLVPLLVACGSSTPDPPPANMSSGTSCTPDRTNPKGMGCAVFLALRTGDEAAYASLMLHEDADFRELPKIMSHAPADLPTPEERERDRAKAGAQLRDTIAKLRERKLEPATMELVDVTTEDLGMRGDVGIAEEIFIDVSSNGVKVRITIDDVAFLRGRWVILDGLKLRE